MLSKWHENNWVFFNQNFDTKSLFFLLSCKKKTWQWKEKHFSQILGKRDEKVKIDADTVSVLCEKFLKQKDKVDPWDFSLGENSHQNLCYLFLSFNRKDLGWVWLAIHNFNDLCQKKGC